MTIYFYYTGETYGAFSAWSRHGFELDGKIWPTLEHYFQAQKYTGTDFEERVRQATTPREAKRMGRDRSWPMRPDWDGARDEVMLRGARRKFETHDDIRALLLSTGDEKLVEKSRDDYYWGCGADGSGRNQLGRTLMAVRQTLRSASRV